MKATVNWETGMPISPSAESTPRPTARLSPITSSGNNAVNTDRYTISRITAMTAAVAMEISSRSCSAEAIMSLKVAGGPVTWTVVVEPVNTSAAMSRTAFTDSEAVGSPRVPVTPAVRDQALRVALTA